MGVIVVVLLGTYWGKGEEKGKGGGEGEEGQRMRKIQPVNEYNGRKKTSERLEYISSSSIANSKALNPE